MSRTKRLLLVLGLGLGAAGVLLPFAPAQPAAAHAELSSASPSDGAELSSAPGKVELRFNEPVNKRFGQIEVTGPDGTKYADGELSVVGKTATQQLKDLGAEGKYVVGWRVVSADGHPISGSYAFWLGAGGSAAGSNAEESGGEAASSSGPPLALIAGGVLLVVIIVGVLLVVRSNRRSESR